MLLTIERPKVQLNYIVTILYNMVTFFFLLIIGFANGGM